MAINVPRIAPNHEKLHFLHCSVRGVLYDLINILGPFPSFCNHEIFINLDLPILLEPHRPFPITGCCEHFLCTIARRLFTRGLGLLIKKVREKYFADTMSFMFIRGLLFSGV